MWHVYLIRLCKHNDVINVVNIKVESSLLDQRVMAPLIERSGLASGEDETESE